MSTKWLKDLRRFLKDENEIPVEHLTGMSVQKLMDIHQFNKILSIKQISREKIIGIANVQALELTGK